MISMHKFPARLARFGSDKHDTKEVNNLQTINSQISLGECFAVKARENYFKAENLYVERQGLEMFFCSATPSIV